MHIDGVRPPPPMSVFPSALHSSSAPAPVTVLPHAVTTTSSVARAASLASQPAPGVVVHQPTVAGVRVGSVVPAPRTASVTQPTLPLAAVCFEFCHCQMCYFSILHHSLSMD